MSIMSRFPHPVPPFPEWERRVYQLPRPVTERDIEAILHGQDEYYRTAGPERVISIHKFGLVEINLIVGVPEMEVWFSPGQRVWTSEYVDALLSMRF
jgi:hypothetical protein